MPDKATFAAGCFWGVEATFSTVDGVLATCVGYTGGHTEDPTYEQVCSGATAHAEAVQVTFDPEKISYAELLNIFWHCHNPTLFNRQGPDVGSQYRSAIFYHNAVQKQQAEQSKQALADAGEYTDPIVTEITPASEFYRAEEYHQKYHEKHGGGCSI